MAWKRDKIYQPKRRSSVFHDKKIPLWWTVKGRLWTNSKRWHYAKHKANIDMKTGATVCQMPYLWSESYTSVIYKSVIKTNLKTISSTTKTTPNAPYSESQIRFLSKLAYLPTLFILHVVRTAGWRINAMYEWAKFGHIYAGRIKLAHISQLYMTNMVYFSAHMLKLCDSRRNAFAQPE